MRNDMTNSIVTPSYVIDVREFDKRIKLVKSYLNNNIGLVFSIKANPFLTHHVTDDIAYIEVCSPGELTICEETHVELSRVVFSGVNKTEDDVCRALDDEVGLFTAESKKHVEIISQLATARGLTVPLIMRVSSGNQFGMDKSDVRDLISRREDYPGVQMIGLHLYTGTQKKKCSQIEKELNDLSCFIESLKEDYGFETLHVEYGPGIGVEYFAENADEKDTLLLSEVCNVLNRFNETYPLTIEMGRFLAANCGTYFTKAMDTKSIGGINYCICDGGIHHMKYYGQNMAMQIPPISVFNKSDSIDRDWTLCGSLCTVADVLVRKVTLNGIGEGSILAFGKVGAYSICEGIALFLSRELPAVYEIDRAGNLKLTRALHNISYFNRETF